MQIENLHAYVAYCSIIATTANGTMPHLFWNQNSFFKFVHTRLHFFTLCLVTLIHSSIFIYTRLMTPLHLSTLVS